MIDDLTSSWTGPDEAIGRLNTVGDLLRRQVALVLKRVGEQVRSGAEALAPRRHGDLAAGIRARLSEGQASLTERITAPFPGLLMEQGVVQYANRTNRSEWPGLRSVLKAHGSWRITPRPFMRPALHAVDHGVQAVLAETVRSVLAGEEGP